MKNKFTKLTNGVITQEFNDWLIEQGFFSSPASTKYHGAFESGLLLHSVNVTETLIDLTDKLNLSWQRETSPIIVGMFHDLCKIDQYTPSEQADHYNNDTKRWAKSFIHNDNTLLKGHGEKSIMLLSQFMTLTEEEVLCIRYHMGAYQTEDWNGYDKAIRLYPTVLWTHTADMYASKVRETK